MVQEQLPEPEGTRNAPQPAAEPIVDSTTNDTGGMVKRLFRAEDGQWRTNEQEFLFPEAEEDMEVEVMDASDTVDALLMLSQRDARKRNAALVGHGLTEKDFVTDGGLTVVEFCEKHGILPRYVEDIFWVQLMNKPKDLLMHGTLDDQSPAPERAAALERARTEGLLPRPDQAAYECDIERRRVTRATALGNPALTSQQISERREEYALLLGLSADASWQEIIAKEEGR